MSRHRGADVAGQFQPVEENPTPGQQGFLTEQIEHQVEVVRVGGDGLGVKRHLKPLSRQHVGQIEPDRLREGRHDDTRGCNQDPAVLGR